MKHLIAVLLCLLLCGCGQEISPVLPETPPEETATDLTAGLYDPDHPIEETYPGLVRAYPLPLDEVQGILPLGKDILVLSGQDKTTLTRFTGETLQKIASITLDFPLHPEDPSLQIHENGISFFDTNHQATIRLDPLFQEIYRIPGPMGLSGKPILSENEENLYYCTSWSVVSWELKTGIRRTIKEMAYEVQELTKLHLEDQILECTIRDQRRTSKLYLSSDQGLEQKRLPEDCHLDTREDRYFATITSGYQKLLIYGTSPDAPVLLLPPENWDQQFYLPEDHGVITASDSGQAVTLDYYELNTGILRTSITLDTNQIPESIVNSKDHGVYILTRDGDADILFRWDPLRQAPDASNATSFKTDYSTDPQIMAACEDYARTIGETYGITVRIGLDAASVQPWDYQFQPEVLAPVIGKELRLLEKRLANYPKTVLDQTKSHFDGLSICLVRSIAGTGDSAGLTSATGIQFFNGTEAYVVITAGAYSEQALYHELYHVMETHILTESTALDQWEALNPANFAYNKNLQDSEIYLKGQTRAFVDHYSMTSPKEDRARVLEYAMLSGKQERFQSEYMQRKLTAVCTGIREAYKLKKHPQALPWEQYLINSLIPDT